MDDTLTKLRNEYKGKENFTLQIATAGTTHADKAQNILKYIHDNIATRDIIITLEKEPTNIYDPYAIKVIVGVRGSPKTHRIGYIPKIYSEFVSEYMGGDAEIIVQEISVVGGSGYNYGIHFKLRIKSKQL